MKTGMKVFLACAIGAFIGSIVALELNRYFWWLGLIVGGLAGYVSYEFKKVVKAIPEAWDIAKKEIKEQMVETSIIRAIKISAYILLGCFFFAIIVFCFLANIMLLDVIFSSKIINMLDFLPSISLLGVIFCFIALVAWTIALVADILELKITDKQFLILMIIFTTMPVIAIPVLIFYTGIKLALIIVRFFKQLFILVHSDIRLLCGIDAAIGASIGYFAGNAVIGAFTGGIFGVVNYELVSKRLLHLCIKNT